MLFTALRRAAAPLFVMAFLLPSIARAGVVAGPGGYDVSYSLDIHTLYGSPVTSIVILESDGTQLNIDTASPVSGIGASTITHSISFLPTSALVFGIDASPTGGRPHLVTFENAAFALANLGRRFDATFGLSENVFLAAVPAAANGDTGAQQTLIDFFTTGTGAGAAFDPAGSFLVVEHTISVIVSNPEPATMTLVAAGLLGLAAARRKRA